MKFRHFRKLTLLALLLLFILVGVAAAHGPSPAQMSNAGWFCFNAGPNSWVHCTPPGDGSSGQTMTVKVFDTQMLGDPEAEQLGTELLIHHDIYAGQRCPQEGRTSYENLLPAVGLPYYACHHFDTHHDH